MKRVVFASVLVLAASFGLIGACKQGEGDRCQVNEDCDSKLCNTAKNTCAMSGTSSSDIDTVPPIDAPLDAPPDAPDAM